MKKIISLTLFLALCSALAGAVLAGVNSITAPIIEEQKIAAVKASLQKIFPTADEFKEITFEDESGFVKNVYEATGEGYAIKVSIQGYKDIITILVGFDLHDKIVGFEVTALNDTPGIGTKVGEPEFANSIIGKPITTKLDTISGATISSSAAIRGIDAAIAVYQSLN
ncbi:MAG: electron transport complex protein RnfG [Erysipelotrichaceae bacterium]|nr:MAG: electron transport complex protein [Erysipelotrichaceae bacterium]TXT19015.1 MAG: electron transport complex protein RnfG [Erysipelotrichaceae bacterium]